MSKWDRNREDDILALMEWLIAQGATTGVALSRQDIATGLDWPLSKLDRIVRYIKEHPEYGFAISLRLGDPWVVVSTGDNKIAGTAVNAERKTAYDNVLASMWTIVRNSASEYVHYSNIAMKNTPEAARARQTKKDHRNLLVSIQQTLNPAKRPAEAELDKYIDMVLDPHPHLVTVGS